MNAYAPICDLMCHGRHSAMLFAFRTDFMWDNDFMHPLDAGHKTIADVAIYLLQQTALQVYR